MKWNDLLIGVGYLAPMASLQVQQENAAAEALPAAMQPEDYYRQSRDPADRNHQKDQKRRRCNVAVPPSAVPRIPALPALSTEGEAAAADQAPVDRKSGGSWRAIPPRFFRCSNPHQPIGLPPS